MEPIVLASESPRRQEFFRLLGLPFISMPSAVDETLNPGMDIQQAVEDLARRKVNTVVDTLKAMPPSLLPGEHNLAWVFGADTIIALDGKVFGKPVDREDAKRMLSAFRGREHKVITAIALYSGRGKAIDSRSVNSSVAFAPLSESEIEWYLDSGEWEGAAGAYKIQGLASCFITEIQGSYSSIVGLPLREIYVMLRDNGYPYGG